MGWQTDQPVDNYLKRRVIYYKKKRESIKGLIKDSGFIEKYGKKKLEKMINERVININKRIEEYEKVIRLIEYAKQNKILP